MNESERSTVLSDHTEALRSMLKSQYHASLAMLKDAIERCPVEAWDGTGHVNEFWQIAYHTLFFTHLYLQPNEAAFTPWEGQQSNVQYPDAIPGPPHPASDLPLIPEPYTKEQILEYWSFCDEMVDSGVDILDLHSPTSGFSWYKMPTKLEHQVINIRHIQHGAAQLADRVRSAAGLGVTWVGSRRTQAPVTTD